MKIITLAAMLGLGLASPLAANAATALHPLAPGASNIEHVSGGCGRFFHRDRFGRCRRNEPIRYLARRPCPPGYHLVPRGCLRNY